MSSASIPDRSGAEELSFPRQQERIDVGLPHLYRAGAPVPFRKNGWVPRQAHDHDPAVTRKVRHTCGTVVEYRRSPGKLWAKQRQMWLLGKQVLVRIDKPFFQPGGGCPRWAALAAPQVSAWGGWRRPSDGYHGPMGTPHVACSGERKKRPERSKRNPSAPPFGLDATPHRISVGLLRFSEVDRKLVRTNLRVRG